jgi:hypothetical protein
MSTMEPSEGRELTDADWVPLRGALPEFAATWNDFVGEIGYEDTLPFCNIHLLAIFVVRQILSGGVDLNEIGSTLEVFYTRIMIAGDEALHGLITVGFLKGLIEAADDIGVPLKRFQPLLAGARTRLAWDMAIEWKRPGYVWNDGVGPVPTAPLPQFIGTVELDRGWSDRTAGYLHMDVRLLSGTIEVGCLVRHVLGKDMYMEWRIIDVRPRSVDLPDEFELKLDPVSAEAYDVFDEIVGQFPFDDPFWQIAKPVEDRSSR